MPNIWLHYTVLTYANRSNSHLPQISKNNLGVVFNSELKFNKQVNSVVKAGYFKLRNIAKKKNSCLTI